MTDRKDIAHRNDRPVADPEIDDEFASPACLAHEVDPDYLFARGPGHPKGRPQRSAGHARTKKNPAGRR